ncbi:MAG: hypothetical protein H0T51_08425 [Pirellulales bacterium]|nr:hypothetical protein [Pirellulales bacterium]
MTVTRSFKPSRRHALMGEAPAALGVPRVAKLMALAICFDQLIQEGVVQDQAELARRGRVTRARLTQIMDLLTLAPQIQLQLLNLEGGGAHGISERRLRTVTALTNWDGQLEAWHEILDERLE